MLYIYIHLHIYIYICLSLSLCACVCKYVWIIFVCMRRCVMSYPIPFWIRESYSLMMSAGRRLHGLQDMDIEAFLGSLAQVSTPKSLVSVAVVGA